MFLSILSISVTQATEGAILVKTSPGRSKMPFLVVRQTSNNGDDQLPNLHLQAQWMEGQPVIEERFLNGF